jgi:hypothetical protein
MWVATNGSRGWSRCLLLALLLLTGCEQQPAGASDTFAELRHSCPPGDPQTCHQINPASRQQSLPDERPTPESLAAQVQRDVAAIIRGMRQTSASNGL